MKNKWILLSLGRSETSGRGSSRFPRGIRGAAEITAVLWATQSPRLPEQPSRLLARSSGVSGRGCAPNPRLPATQAGRTRGKQT